MGAAFDAAHGQQDVVGDGNVACGNTFRDPVIRCIRCLVDDHICNERVPARADAAIADHVNGEFMAFCHTDDFVLYGTGIRIDEDFSHFGTL